MILENYSGSAAAEEFVSGDHEQYMETVVGDPAELQEMTNECVSDIHNLTVALARFEHKCIVESAGVHDLYGRPAHAYTKGLLDSIPRLDQRGQTLYAIGGLPPNLMRIPPGCPFNPRCVYATDVCRSGEPPALVEVLPRRLAACHHTKEVLADGRA